jgi:PDDEXK-like domain of unknown function (DUF3799)
MRDPWITEPGPYDLTDEEYHADPVVGGSISSSGARTLLPVGPRPGSPALYQYEREHRRQRDYYDFGHLVHTLLLGTGAEIVEVKADDWKTKRAQDARKKIRAEGRVPVLTAQLLVAHEMVLAVLAHPVVGPLFVRPGLAETSYVARDPETKVMCRARVDWMPHVTDDARLLVVDYKTAVNASPSGFQRIMWEHGYHMQGPWYCDVLSWLERNHGLEPQFILVAQEKTPPYLVSYGWPSARAIEWGRVLNRKARDVYRQCVEADDWPGYGDEAQEWDIPGWLDRLYTDEYELGLYNISGDIR